MIWAPGFVPDDGWLDPHGVLQGFRRKARSLGAAFIEDEVVGLDVSGRAVRAVRLESGRQMEAGAIIHAAGARAKELCAMAGWTVAIAPVPRYEHYFETDDEIE